MENEGSIVREVLSCVATFRNSAVFIAPSGIGPIEPGDREVVLHDAELLARLGIDLAVVEYGGPFWSGMGTPATVPLLVFKNEDELIEEATRRKVKKVCLASGTDRIATSSGTLDDVPLPVAEKILAQGLLVKPETQQALALAVACCHAGIPRVHFFNAHRSGALLQELFTTHGAGTMVYAGDMHKEVRAATWDDRFSLSELLHPVIRRHTTDFIHEHLAELRVFAVDGDVLGAARLTPQGNALWVRTLTHSPRLDVSEILRNLLEGATEEARSSNFASVIVPRKEIPPLMRIQPWFAKLGFVKGGAGRQDAWLKTLA